MANTPKKPLMFLIVRNSEWFQAYETYQEAQEHAMAGDTILEVANTWDVSSKLTYRKESASDYF